MPFTINGNVCGAHFNNVSGNLNQVSHLTQIFNSHGGHPGVASSRHLINGIQGMLNPGLHETILLST
jgi:hypothetical protein